MFTWELTGDLTFRMRPDFNSLHRNQNGFPATLATSDEVWKSFVPVGVKFLPFWVVGKLNLSPMPSRLEVLYLTKELLVGKRVDTKNQKQKLYVRARQ